ncbi:YceI family protein [Streptomyces sp. NPDC005181]|uniref:YceI family protein n=1 Tax=Streptomyces sp. NPDC005181 TaxID=3156869 RepID=UPI0033A8AFD9
MTAEGFRQGEYVIDPSSSSIDLSARHLFGPGGVRGSFTLRSGAVSIAEPATASHVRAVADATSFSSGSAARDRKVLSRAFLETGSHPDFTFADAWCDANGMWRLNGLLSGPRRPGAGRVHRDVGSGA